MRLLRAPAAPSLLSVVEMGQKGISMVKVAQGVSKGFKSNFGRVRMLMIVDVK